MRASLRRVLETGAQDVASPFRHDVEEPDRPGVYTQRYWSPVNAPVLDADGEVVLIVHRLAEITDLVRDVGPATDERHHQVELELYARSRQLQQVNERLRRANAQERHVALALQQAMMPPPQPLGRHPCAVRYRPAVNSLNVCGDWYDVTWLPDGNYAVAVGDVVGHGLAAAGVMGQLRSALTAAVRVVNGPAAALDALDLYARCVEGALSTTAVQVVVASAERLPCTAARAIRHRSWSIRTGRWTSWTGPRTRPWAPRSSTHSARRRRARTPRAPSSSSTPTD